MKAFSYLRTSSSDSKDKMGLPVQRQGVEALAARLGYEIQTEFADDITGKIHLHARPQGKLLVAALLANGTKTVLVYDSNRLARTQPVFWRAIELFRDNGISVIDKDGTDLCGTVMGGVNGMLAEMDREATIKRLAAGKAIAKALGKRTDGRYAYGEHPLAMYGAEKDVIRVVMDRTEKGQSRYAIAKELNEKCVQTRMGKQFGVMQIGRIILRERSKQNGTKQVGKNNQERR